MPPTPRPLPVVASPPSESEAERLATRDVWRNTKTSPAIGNEHDPLSAEWFRYLETKRYRRQGRWLPSTLEFTRHARENLLGVSDGLGLDWVRFAEEGAQVSIVDPAIERVRLQKQQFAVRGIEASVTHAPFDHLPAASNAVDVVCAVFHERPAAWQELIGEMFRVLRPGGKVIAVVPAHYNADRFLDIHRPWRIWNRCGSAPKPEKFTGRDLRTTFEPFYDVRISKRHLRRSELPYLWRWVLLPAAERLLGRFLIVKGFKPLLVAKAADKRLVA